jgi:transcriptional regulator with PAS, ATPase and Fis domain
METVQSIKQRLSIIGNDAGLNRAVEKAVRVAPTDISVLVTGESGVGKESIPKIIHQLSQRKPLTVSCLDMKKGLSQEQLKPDQAILK